MRADTFLRRMVGTLRGLTVGGGWLGGTDGMALVTVVALVLSAEML